MKLSGYTKTELKRIREEVCITDDECIIFDMLCKGKSVVQISEELHLSTRSVDNRIHNIRQKMNKL